MKLKGQLAGDVALLNEGTYEDELARKKAAFEENFELLREWDSKRHGPLLCTLRLRGCNLQGQKRPNAARA